ncbi:putative protein phosphatase 2C 76 [Capsicum annuum]|uniref:putative protein phosphatase 2C 76 n=1 Tax=Capsicum annuum TaxID=4072 RepID=UPI001FB180B4|nr:putative protein phosphatase 2C 76 [Capsicum annuum]
MKELKIVWTIIMLFGLFMACFVGIIMNPRVGIDNSNSKAESEEDLSEELLKLSIPIPTQNCHFATSQGRRLYQEDQVTCNVNLKFPLLGRDGIEEVAVGAVAVFDGHIGHVASQMASDVFLDKLMLKVALEENYYSGYTTIMF